jgi:hypothetical protein
MAALEPAFEVLTPEIIKDLSPFSRVYISHMILVSEYFSDLKIIPLEV